MDAPKKSPTKINHLFFTVVTPSNKSALPVSTVGYKRIDGGMKTRTLFAERQLQLEKLKVEDAAIEDAFNAALAKADDACTALAKAFARDAGRKSVSRCGRVPHGSACFTALGGGE